MLEENVLPEYELMIISIAISVAIKTRVFLISECVFSILWKSSLASSAVGSKDLSSKNLVAAKPIKNINKGKQ